MKLFNWVSGLTKSTKIIAVVLSVGVVAGVSTGIVLSTQHKHDYKTDIIAPTCLEQGYTIYTCECGDTYNADIVNALGHKGGTATCTEKAKCSVCNSGYGQLKNHEYTTLKHNETQHWCECTCGDKNGIENHKGGTATYTEKAKCSVCGESYGEVLPPSLGYNVNSDNKSCTITSIGNYTETEVYIPEKLFGYTVTVIAEKAFENQTQITKLVLPSTLKTIGTRAFYGCTGLTEITIPASVTSIGTQIFYKSNIETVYYDSTYASQDNPFLNVKNVIFGGKYIPSYMLYNCASVQNVTIPDSVTSIGSYAFQNCTAKITWGENPTIKSIGSYAFYEYKGTSITIPDSVTSIGDCAFEDCRSLTSIIIPDSVTSIGYDAFYGCSSLTSIIIPDSVTSIGNSAFYNCWSLTSVTIGDSVTSIGSSAFYNCSSLTSITIPDTVMAIGYSTFYYCSSLTSIIIPDSVTTIGYNAFGYCSSLTSITIPDSVTSIGDRAFYYCRSLTSITIPDSVTSIGDNAFYNCSSLQTIYCEAQSKPSGWYSYWKYGCYAQVLWGYKG